MGNCTRLPPGGSYESYEGPQRDCPEHGEPTGPRTLTVTWHENAIRQAVKHGVAVMQTVDPDHTIYTSPDTVLTWMDLACLLDVARAWTREQEEATPHQRPRHRRRRPRLPRP